MYVCMKITNTGNALKLIVIKKTKKQLGTL